MSDERKTVTVVIRDEDGYIPSDKRPEKEKPKAKKVNEDKESNNVDET